MYDQFCHHTNVMCNVKRCLFPGSRIPSAACQLIYKVVRTLDNFQISLFDSLPFMIKTNNMTGGKKYECFLSWKCEVASQARGLVWILEPGFVYCLRITE